MTNLRNPVFTADGGIDCEIENPAYGWIPFTARADDVEPLGREIYAAAEPDALPAPEPLLADVQVAKLVEINRAYAKQMAAILDQYPHAETLTFDKQEREARAWAADNTAATPYLDAMLVERPLTKAELVDRIIVKADAFVTASGNATGKRQRLEDDIATATDIPTVEAIAW